MLQARRASAWPQAVGRITQSGVAATRHTSVGGTTEVTNAPAIAYAFAANGRTFTGTRISIGEDTGGANTEATLAHYPVGAAVVVYYDPADPGNCVLEREVPKDVPKGCAAVLAIGAALLVGGHWMFVHFLRFIAPYTQDGEGRLMVGAAIGGLVALMLFAGSWFGAREKIVWPVVRGRVEKSGTESFRKRSNRGTVSVYAPAVEYSYRVDAHEYRGRQITLGEEFDGSRAQALAVAARYQQGAEVAVHYDPDYPGDAALQIPPPGRVAWVLLGVAVICFGVAAYAGGIGHYLSRP